MNKIRLVDECIEIKYRKIILIDAAFEVNIRSEQSLEKSGFGIDLETSEGCLEKAASTAEDHLE